MQENSRTLLDRKDQHDSLPVMSPVIHDSSSYDGGSDHIKKDVVASQSNTGHSGFTPVNGRSASLESHKANGVADSRGRPPPSNDLGFLRPPQPRNDDWRNGITNGNRVSHNTQRDSGRMSSASSPGKRKRTTESEEDDELVERGKTPVSPTFVRRRLGSVLHHRKTSESPENIGHAIEDSSKRSVVRVNAYESAELGNGNRDREWQKRVNSEIRASDTRTAVDLIREHRPLESLTERSSGGSMDRPADHDESEGFNCGTEVTRAGVQVDTKKRKRQFSNRTKSGCQTCRRRKKKCDESKPECTNCLRGGFVCEGYPSKSSWEKQSISSRPPVPLQSKHDCIEQPMYYVAPRDPSENSSVRKRPIHKGDELNLLKSSSSWPLQESHRPYSSEIASSNSYQRHQNQHQPLFYHPSSSLNVSQFHSGPSYSQPIVTSHPSLQHVPINPTIPLKSEKEKMLSGEMYLPFSSQLVEERDICKAALWKFNNAISVGASREERARLFRAVLEPKFTRTDIGPHNPIGSIGRHVQVEAPFTCEYGFNINIGDNVVIGQNCTILDPCTIIIRAGSVLGPDVKIYGNSYSVDPTMRNGSQGQAYGKQIIIEEDVFVGGNVTILAGVTIHKGVTIGAGSIVSKDIVEYNIAHMGVKASEKRGLWKS